MLLKMLFVMAVCRRGAAGEDVLDVLAGVRGGNRVSLCMGRAPPGAGGAARCGGALWRSQWVVARASCLERRELFKVLVLRDGLGVSCYDLELNREMSQAKTIQFQLVHPEYRQSARGDLALLGLTSRYWHLDRLANTSYGNNLLDQIEPWLEEMVEKYPLGPFRSRDHTHKSYLLSTPMRMFITTIIVPFVSFILFFLFVIFFTGPKEQIPYKSIEYEKFEEVEKEERNDKNEEYDNYDDYDKYDKYDKCEDSLLQV